MRTAAVFFGLVISFPSTLLASDNQLTEEEKKAGWILLFNGQDHTGWRCNNGKPRAIKDFARVGYLGLQDHGQKVWYKNVKLLEL